MTKRFNRENIELFLMPLLKASVIAGLVLSVAVAADATELPQQIKLGHCELHYIAAKRGLPPVNIYKIAQLGNGQLVLTQEESNFLMQDKDTLVYQETCNELMRQIKKQINNQGQSL